MAYISATDVAAIRKELKDAFPKWKFGVRKESGGLAVAVNIKQGTAAFEGKTYAQVNQYWIDSHWTDAEDAMVLKKINEIMHNAPGRAGGKVFFDESDAMTDYFHTAF
jgi:hypothetical protein